MIHDADVALYRAKENGRDRVEVFDDELEAWSARRRDTAGELRSAVADGIVIPYFQPIVDLRTGEVIAVEALAR